MQLNIGTSMHSLGVRAGFSKEDENATGCHALGVTVGTLTYALKCAGRVGLLWHRFSLPHHRFDELRFFLPSGAYLLQDISLP